MLTIMQKDTLLQHIHSNYSAIVINQTARGYKLLVTDNTTSKSKKKPKIEFYNNIDFHKEKGLWKIKA